MRLWWKVIQYVKPSRRAVRDSWLAGTANQLDDLLENASKKNVSYFDFLHTLVLGESEARQTNLLSKRMKSAKLP
jgi:hypothetical protein